MMIFLPRTGSLLRGEEGRWEGELRSALRQRLLRAENARLRSELEKCP